MRRYNYSGKEMSIEPTHEILALFVLRKFILLIRMRSHPVWLDVWFLVWPFVCFHSSYVRTAKALARLRGCAGSPEPSRVASAIRTILSWVGSNVNLQPNFFFFFFFFFINWKNLSAFYLLSWPCPPPLTQDSTLMWCVNWREIFAYKRACWVTGVGSTLKN